jgi:hypothetical protein
MRILAVIITVCLAAFFCLSYYAGVLDKADVALSVACGPYNLIYREHKGPYKGVRVALYDVYRYLSEKRSITPQKGFAIFYDNPRTTKSADLRSIGGYITDSLLANVAAPYSVRVFQRTPAVVGVFPLRSFMSPMTGPMKFYPAMLALLEKTKRTPDGPVMEIYDVPGRKILYIAPVK